MLEGDRGLMVKLAILGGTGKAGAGLAKRWAEYGYGIVIGSRDAARAQKTAKAFNQELDVTHFSGMDNVSAAAEGDIVILSVPYASHKSTLLSVKDYIQGKILVDITVPTPYPEPVFVPEGKSAALEAQELLGEDVRVVSAFQNVSAVKVNDINAMVECDVLVTGDDEGAKQEVIDLAEAAGMRGIDAGHWRIR